MDIRLWSSSVIPSASALRFEPAHTRGLTLRDFDVPQDVFMVIEPRGSVRERLQGAVRYPSEFAEA